MSLQFIANIDICMYRLSCHQSLTLQLILHQGQYYAGNACPCAVSWSESDMPSGFLTAAVHKCAYHQAKLTLHHKAHDDTNKRTRQSCSKCSFVLFVGYMLQTCLYACIWALQLTVCMVKKATEQRRSTGLVRSRTLAPAPACDMPPFNIADFNLSTA